MINHRSPRTPFRPNPLVRSATAQTVLAMVRPGDLDVTQDERPVLLAAGRDLTGLDSQRSVRMLGYYNAHRLPGPSRGLVMILHGWEGCSHSNYNLVLAQALVQAGYDAFRLNLRDHGPGLHVNPYLLNRGLFLGTLIAEAAEATRQVAALSGGRPFYIAGASMGGNFALRLAIWHSTVQPIPNLRKIVAVCPAVNPGRATEALDRLYGTRRYFRQRWVRSLRAKQQLYPELYDFRSVEAIPSVYAMTDWLLQHYGHLSPSHAFRADEYFASYAVTNEKLAQVSVATTIIAAENDPVIPVVDFYAIAPHRWLDVQIHTTGGHCGFIDAPPVRHRMPDLVLPELLRMPALQS